MHLKRCSRFSMLITAQAAIPLTIGRNTSRARSERPKAKACARIRVPACGAEITGSASMGATICPYCGNAAIVENQFAGTFQPDYIVPFRIDKKAAMQSFEATCKRLPFLPDEFKNKRKIEEMSGIYVPFWMFDCQANAAITYRGERNSYWSDSENDYVKTDHYKLFRSGTLDFENLPVDASKKADDAYMDALEPYNLGEAVRV